MKHKSPRQVTHRVLCLSSTYKYREVHIQRKKRQCPMGTLVLFKYVLFKLLGSTLGCCNHLQRQASRAEDSRMEEQPLISCHFPSCISGFELCVIILLGLLILLLAPVLLNRQVWVYIERTSTHKKFSGKCLRKNCC